MFGSYMDDVIHLWFEIKDDPSPLLFLQPLGGLSFFGTARQQRILILLLSFFHKPARTAER